MNRLDELRNEYRMAMNKAADEAQRYAALEEMDRVSEFSSESERKREAFTALNRAINIVEAELDAHEDHAFATGGIAGVNAANVGPVEEETFREAMERQRASALKIMSASDHDKEQRLR